MKIAPVRRRPYRAFGTSARAGRAIGGLPVAGFLSKVVGRRGTWIVPDSGGEQAGVTPEQLREALENVLICRRAERAKKNPSNLRMLAPRL